jgi:hypothetical protein
VSGGSSSRHPENSVVRTGSEAYDLVDSEERAGILLACLVQACVINTHPPFSILFWYENWVAYPVWVLNFLNEANGQKPG